MRNAQTFPAIFLAYPAEFDMKIFFRYKSHRDEITKMQKIPFDPGGNQVLGEAE